MVTSDIATSQRVKSCCAATYGSDWTRRLLGDSMHPGGEALTQRLGLMLDLGPGSRVLDVAASRGVSAMTLAQCFGCEVTGIDLSEACIGAARDGALRAGVGEMLTFVVGDAEVLPFGEDKFDAVVCECSFCTFPDKLRAAREMARVLKPGGRLGLSDLILRGELPPKLRTLAGWVACVADARRDSEYIDYLESAGLRYAAVEPHDAALVDLVRQIRVRLLGARLLGKLGRISLAGVDMDQAVAVARAAEAAVESGNLGYALLTAVKPT